MRGFSLFSSHAARDKAPATLRLPQFLEIERSLKVMSVSSQIITLRASVHDDRKPL